MVELILLLCMTAVRGGTKHIESTGNGGEQTVENTVTVLILMVLHWADETVELIQISPNSYVSWNWKNEWFRFS